MRNNKIYRNLIRKTNDIGFINGVSFTVLKDEDKAKPDGWYIGEQIDKFFDKTKKTRYVYRLVKMVNTKEAEKLIDLYSASFVGEEERKEVYEYLNTHYNFRLSLIPDLLTYIEVKEKGNEMSIDKMRKADEVVVNMCNLYKNCKIIEMLNNNAS